MVIGKGTNSNGKHLVHLRYYIVAIIKIQREQQVVMVELNKESTNIELLMNLNKIKVLFIEDNSMQLENKFT